MVSDKDIVRVIRGLLYYADGHSLSPQYAKDLRETINEAHKIIDELEKKNDLSSN